MLRRIVITFSILLISSTASAQQQVVTIPISCHSCGGESYHHAYCDAAQKGVSQKGFPEHSALPQEDAGQYVAPPANGPIFGESNSVGIEGLSLHVPPLNLALPTLKFPSLFRVRNNARMITNPSEAPHQSSSPASSPVQLMMLPNPQPAAANVPEPPAAASPTRQDAGQKSPVQDSFKGAAYAPNPAGQIQSQEILRLESQVQKLESMLSRIEQANEVVRMQSSAISGRLPSTLSARSVHFAQPANHVEPARLPVTNEILQRLPSPY